MSFELFRSSVAVQAVVKVPAIGLDLTILLPPSATGRELTILETTNAPGFGPPLHRHRETEIFRVLEGRYLFEVDGQRFEAGTGEIVTVPAGRAHAFLNITEHPARQMVLMLPGMDAGVFFRELARITQGGIPDRDTLNEFGRPWHVEFLGPPLARHAPQVRQS